MTHYDTLGVAPGASADEVKAAYRALARHLHPDRRAGDERAASAMARVNEAWRVLSDPARRAAYDRELRGGAVPGPGAPAGTAGMPPAPERVVRPPLTVRPRTVVAAAVVLTVLIFVVITVSAGGGGGGGEVDGVPIPGDCVVLVAGRPAIEVSCDSPHDGVVVQLVTFDRPCPAGTEYAVDPATSVRVCVRLDG